MVQYEWPVRESYQFEISGFGESRGGFLNGIKDSFIFGLESPNKVGFGCLGKDVV